MINDTGKSLILEFIFRQGYMATFAKIDAEPLLEDSAEDYAPMLIDAGLVCPEDVPARLYRLTARGREEGHRIAAPAEYLAGKWTDEEIETALARTYATAGCDAAPAMLRARDPCMGCRQDGCDCAAITAARELLGRLASGRPQSAGAPGAAPCPRGRAPQRRQFRP